MDETDRLVQKLKKIQALFQGATTQGERAAALEAAQRIQDKLQQRPIFEKPPAAPAVEEFKFSFNNPWSRALFLALLQKNNIKPFRYPGQHRKTIMAKMSRSFCDDVLWPEYVELDKTLTKHLTQVAEDIIRRAVGPVS